MKIALGLFLDSKKRPYEEKKLLEVAAKRKYQVFKLDKTQPIPLKLTTARRVLDRLLPVNACQACILRVGIANFEAGHLMGKYLENNGVTCLNRPDSLRNTRNKFLSLQTLEMAAINVPQTLWMPRDFKTLEKFSRATGSKKIVIKTNQGSGGVGVMLAQNAASALCIIDYLQQRDQAYFVQEFIDGSYGQDIRVLVLGGKIVGSVLRKATHPDEFRSNFSLKGGRVDGIDITNAEKELALKATHALGLDFAGVDLIRGVNQSYVLEVNGVPGFETIDLIYQTCFASQLYDYVEARMTTRLSEAS